MTSTLIGSGRPLFNIPDFREFASAGAPTIGIEMDTKHTRGPWSVGYNAMTVQGPSDKGGAFPVCDIRGWGYLTGLGHGALGLDHEQAVAIQTANATLIAAAPDLLEALTGLFQSYKALADSGDAGNWKIENFPEGKAALAAIAKAEGRS